MKLLCLILFLFAFSSPDLSAQDSLLVATLQQHRQEFKYDPAEGFSGEGWSKVIKEAQENQYFLIGETHGINELPLLIDGITKEVQYHTFVAEIDPWLARILEEKAGKAPEPEGKKWFSQNNAYLSFYSYQNDFKLLQTLAKRNTKLVGIDQITALNDAPVYDFLATQTRNKTCKQTYSGMALASRNMLKEYSEGKTKKIYLMSDQFPADLQKLREQKLTANEKQALDRLELSHQIYTAPKGHFRRINLMKQQLMEHYHQGLLSGKTMFRLGAMHSSRHESYFTIFDVGNLAHNLAASQNNGSYHVAVFPKTGEAAGPIKGMPARKTEQNKDLEVLFSGASDTNWTYYDLRPVRALLEKQKLTVSNDFLYKTIKGYDGIIIVPVATAAEF